MKPHEILKRDWQEATEDLRSHGIGKNPEHILPPESYERILETYQMDPKKGKAMMKQHVSVIIASFMSAFEESLSTLSGAEDEIDQKEKNEAVARVAKHFVTADVALNFNLIREFLGLTYDDVAELTGVAKSAIYKFSRGETHPRLPSLYMIAMGLGVHVDILTMDFEKLKVWSSVLRQASPISNHLDEYPLENTHEETRLMWEEKHPEGLNPGDLIMDIEDAAREVTSEFWSPGAALGAVVGRLWGGMHGAFVAGYLGHKLEAAQEQNMPVPFPYPGSRIVQAVRRGLATY